MPITRRSTRGATAARSTLSKQQSTLSFNHRVTKGSAAKAAKDSKLSSPSPSPKVEQPAREEVEVDELAEQLAEQLVEKAETPKNKEPVEEKTEVQARAEKISDVQVKRYWKGVEDARLARRVHQEDLGLPEKVLRYFDVSSQYGVSQIHVPRCPQRPKAIRSCSCQGQMTADGEAALHWSASHEAMVPSREVGPQSTHRGLGCAGEGREAGQHGYRDGCDGSYHGFNGHWQCLKRYYQTHLSGRA